MRLTQSEEVLLSILTEGKELSVSQIADVVEEGDLGVPKHAMYSAASRLQLDGLVSVRWTTCGGTPRRLISRTEKQVPEAFVMPRLVSENGN